MCAALMNAESATIAELELAIARKLKKFGSFEAMPAPTRELVMTGQQELKRRAEQEK